MNPVTFKSDNKTFTVDLINQPGIWRQNAMTWYQFVHPSVLLASEVSTNVNSGVAKKLFYLIYTCENDWVQVDITTGENVLNILKTM